MVDTTTSMTNLLQIEGEPMSEPDWQAIMDSKSYTLEEVKEMLRKWGVEIPPDDEDYAFEGADKDDYTFEEQYENSYIEEGLE